MSSMTLATFHLRVTDATTPIDPATIAPASYIVHVAMGEPSDGGPGAVVTFAHSERIEPGTEIVMVLSLNRDTL